MIRKLTDEVVFNNYRGAVMIRHIIPMIDLE